MGSTVMAQLELDATMKSQIDELAAARRQTTQWVLREAVAEYLVRQEQRAQSRNDAMAALDHYETTGLHLTDEEADEWLAKLEAGEGCVGGFSRGTRGMQ